MDINVTNLVISVLCCAFTSVVCIPLVVYYTYHYYNLRHLQPFRRRQPLLLVSVSVAGILFALNMQAYLMLYGLNWDKTHQRLIEIIGIQLVYSLVPKTPVIIMDGSIRIFPDIHQCHFVHMYTYTYTYMYMYVYIYIYITWNAFLYNIVCYRKNKNKNRGESFLLQGDVGAAFVGVPTGFYLCIGMTFACMIPKYKDYFEVHEELTMILKLASVNVVTYLLTYAIFDSWVGPFTRVLLFSLSYFVTFFFTMIKSTWWVMRKYYSSIENHLRANNTHIAGLIQKGSNYLWSIYSRVTYACTLYVYVSIFFFFFFFFNDIAKYSLLFTLEVLPNNKTEFSSENLLCFLELSQFRQMVKSKYERDKVEVTDPLSNRFVLSDQLPQSSIVHNDHWDNEQKAVALIEKYIAVGAQYEVNISYDMRMNFLTLLRGRTLQINPFTLMSSSELIFLFDPVLKDIFQLMRDSYSRFLLTNAYSKYAEYTKQLNP
ncbi:hypothetical protein RFI_13508 [Reticulomyxa filosa]|uniref:RGS domain-containing protein n=1 Tax=Reticulomyxa filosa TaxID=46433 RepID=X6NCD1_RETFI|nr:hypothetical protein RFI_13508 [Reticulomyxa filosa]|eukprot:ETO23671.1 hypothetical protein RFI_13508 [Reticulomyxa filosa]